MHGVPAQFVDDRDRAQCKHFAQLPGVEVYRAHIEHHEFEPHTHEAYGIGAIEYGAECFRYRGVNHVAPADSLVLMNPDELHTGQSGTEGGWRYRMIYLTPEILAEVSGEPSWWFNDAVTHHPQFARATTALINALWQSDEPLAQSSLLSELLSLTRHWAKAPQPLRLDAPQRFTVVKEYLRAHLDKRMTLPELATLADLSPYHFLRQFKAQYHVTPQQMLMAYRLYEAKNLLTQGLPPAQVAAAVGLTDQAHLTRAFNRFYGVTPARYQKQVR